MSQHCAECGRPGTQTSGRLTDLSADDAHSEEVLRPGARYHLCQVALTVVEQLYCADLTILGGGDELAGQLRHLHRAPHQLARLKRILPVVLENLRCVRGCRLGRQRVLLCRADLVQLRVGCVDRDCVSRGKAPIGKHSDLVSLSRYVTPGGRSNICRSIGNLGLEQVERLGNRRIAIRDVRVDIWRIPIPAIRQRGNGVKSGLG